MRAQAEIHSRQKPKLRWDVASKRIVLQLPAARAQNTSKEVYYFASTTRVITSCALGRTTNWHAVHICRSCAYMPLATRVSWPISVGNEPVNALKAMELRTF